MHILNETIDSPCQMIANWIIVIDYIDQSFYCSTPYLGYWLSELKLRAKLVGKFQLSKLIDEFIVQQYGRMAEMEFS